MSPTAQPRIRFGNALLIGVVAALAAGAYHLGRTRTERLSRDTPPALEYECIGPLAVASSSLHLGEVWEEPEFVHRLTVQNRGSGEVKVTDVLTSCGCVSVSPRTFTVPPGGSTQLAVTLDLTTRTQAELGADVRPMAIDVYPVIPAAQVPGKHPSWRITGRVRSRLTLDTFGLHFGERPVFDEPAEPRAVLAVAHVPVQELKVETADAGVKAHVRLLDPGGRRYKIALTPDTSVLSPGPFKTNAIVSIVAPSGETLFGTRLPIEGTVRPEPSLLPGRLILGPRPIGSTATGTLVVQTRSPKEGSSD